MGSEEQKLPINVQQNIKKHIIIHGRHKNISFIKKWKKNKKNLVSYTNMLNKVADYSYDYDDDYCFFDTKATFLFHITSNIKT